MGLQERNQVWRNRLVTDVVREIGRRYDYADIVTELDPDPHIEGRTVHQDGKTDLAFLQELAEQYHAKCFVELDENGREVLYFIPERRVLTARRADRLLLRYRMGPFSNLISFTPRFDMNYIDRYRQMNDIDRRGQPISNREREAPVFQLWPLNQARVVQANQRDQTRITTLYAIGAVRTQDLQDAARSAVVAVGAVAVDQTEYESINITLDSRSQGQSSQGRTFGNIWLRAKSLVILDGLHERFNGEWYVNNVQHKIDVNGYVTDFKCVR
jgi:phage protein D